MPTDYKIDSTSAPFVEELLQDYLREPAKVSPEWQGYFEALLQKDPALRQMANGHAKQPASLFHPPKVANRYALPARVSQGSANEELFQERAAGLIEAYRDYGYSAAKLSPFGFDGASRPELGLESVGLSSAVLQRLLPSPFPARPGQITLEDCLACLREVYCGPIGLELRHIDDAQMRNWLVQRMEAPEEAITQEAQQRILQRLTEAYTFEEFLRHKYTGAKVFSLEGAEVLIPLLDVAIEQAAGQGVAEVVLAMAHRGRLNVLANTIGKPPREIFREFEDPPQKDGRGFADVKYHLGFSGDWVGADGKKVHLSLCFNPSHLEFVNPVALGRMRAKQDRAADAPRRTGVTILVHGDAAFSGEGVTQETLNLAQLGGYNTGGTLHVIVNNQIGFTTGPDEGRSTRNSGDVAKMLPIPIFHMNGEDPEAVARVVRIAMDFRHEFQRDVLIDLHCYRRFGHNEADEPAFTQPLLYKAVRERPNVRELYLRQLVEQSRVEKELADQQASERRELMRREFELAKKEDQLPEIDYPIGIWAGYQGGDEPAGGDAGTAVKIETLRSLLEKLTQTPEGFHVHPKLLKFLELRRKMATGEVPVDWATAEALAIASLAVEGHAVRLSGQDSQRGTFSQRHAVLHDAENGERYSIFSNLAPKQAPVEIVNSPLSEAGVLGFDYGYSLDAPEALVMWEAQFGDFCNAAQIIIDQFIATAEVKWRRLSGLVMLLPHSLEGQGPEHSSARLERFLALAVGDNIQVLNATTPAQYFHALRRQVIRKWRKPLVVLTPKSLLRDKRAVSPLEELSTGSFRRIIADQREPNAPASRVLLCSGKVYFELADARDEAKADAAILRVEQLYPLTDEAIAAALKPYPQITPVYWVQEEPVNMGAWPYLRRRFGEWLLGRYPFEVIARPTSASPATGSKRQHETEQQDLLRRALEGK
ncbi:MAG: 2-oxoglutarate dehydrogenase E1 component [Planctomycetales bacterium]|nr:2-oxoglutarate dehydrogenase E1 component [Planctomycetales bacterium]